MRAKHWLIGVAGALAVGFTAMTAQAAPVSGLSTELKSTAGQMSNVDQARYHCWWRHGRRHCRWSHYRPYYYGGGYPYAYPYYGPSFGLYFGGGHRHHHRHWR
jgi:hypothetical protein